jgi:hypothetical protein
MLDAVDEMPSAPDSSVGSATVRRMNITGAAHRTIPSTAVGSVDILAPWSVPPEPSLVSGR